LSRRFSGQELGGEQSAAGVAIAGVGAVSQFHSLAQRAEDDGMFAGVVADTDRVHADFGSGPFADQAFTAMTQLVLTHGLLHRAGKLKGSAARRILLEAVMTLENLHIKALFA